MKTNEPIRTEPMLRAPTERSSTPSEAVVCAILGPRGVRVQREDGVAFDATLAVAGSYSPVVGDRVLALATEERAWVIGVVGALRAVEPDAPLRAADGVEARLGGGGRTLTVSDARGEVLFEHDATTGKSLVRSSAGLQVRADGGDLDLVASDTVRIVAGRKVEIDAEHEASITTSGGANRFSLGLDGTRLSTTALDVVSGIGKLALHEGTFAVDRLQTAVNKGRHFIGVAETRAGRIVERAKNVYREVAELEQTRAGRVRIIAREAYSVLADRATIKAEDDLTLLGEKIHLA